MKTNTFFKEFKGKKIVITGHTGFKGSWLSLWLNYLGANVYGISKFLIFFFILKLLKLV